MFSSRTSNKIIFLGSFQENINKVIKYTIVYCLKRKKMYITTKKSLMDYMLSVYIKCHQKYWCMFLDKSGSRNWFLKTMNFKNWKKSWVKSLSGCSWLVCFVLCSDMNYSREPIYQMKRQVHFSFCLNFRVHSWFHLWLFPSLVLPFSDNKSLLSILCC